MSERDKKRLGRREGAHIDVLAEVVAYGRNVLGMSDPEMAAELGYTRQRIQQARARKGTAARRCKAGLHLLPPNFAVYCPKCDKSPSERGSILCLFPGCARMSRGGECHYHAYLRRVRESDEHKERHLARVAKWKKDAAKDPVRRVAIRQREKANMQRYLERKALGVSPHDPLSDLL